MKCKVSKLCGGCQLLQIPYEKQAKIKQQKVEDLVQKNHLHLTVMPPHMGKQAISYRNKVIVGFAKQPKTKQIFSGLYAPHSHRVINTKGCLMHPKLVNEIIDEITYLADSMKLQLYNPKNGTGLLRHVLIRYAKDTNQVMVVFVTSRKEFPSRRNMVKALTSKFPQIRTILQNVNPRDTSVVLENETSILYGDGMITDKLCGLDISFTPSAFYQINHDQCEVLYSLAAQMLNLSGKETLLDTYCGVGTIGLALAKDCKEVTGVEINRDAVANAKFNAKANEIKNIRFVAMDSTRFMEEAKQVRMQYDAIVLDPPRAGTTRTFIQSACGLKPKKILYISCDPRTQVRDLKIFKEFGYVGKKMELVDMFPNTDQIESLVLLEPLKAGEKGFHSSYTSKDKKSTYKGKKVEEKKGFRTSLKNKSSSNRFVRSDSPSRKEKKNRKPSKPKRSK